MRMDEDEKRRLTRSNSDSADADEVNVEAVGTSID
jgi:hypothetical protein